MIILDIGCGQRKTPNSIGVDIRKIKGIDVIADIRCLPFKTNSADEIICSPVVEHVKNLTKVMRGLHRILKPGGILNVKVPHCDSWWFKHNPEHRVHFTMFTMHYYSASGFDEFNLDFKFDIIERRLNLGNRFANFIFNLRPEYFEKFIRHIGFFNLNAEIIYKLRVIK